MTPRHLYTIRWTQPYATDRLRPYLRHLQEELEQVIETLLEHKQFDDAKEVIARIKSL
jgi:hypothetical protein